MSRDTHGQVGGTAGATSSRLWVDETAADAEIAQLDVAPVVE